MCLLAYPSRESHPAMIDTPMTTSNDTAKIAAIREELPAVRRFVYLNVGTNGPLPRRSHAALVEQSQIELEEGRIGMQAYARILGVKDQVRAAVAALLGCESDEVALTHNTTEGMNIALLGIDWAAGDEIITATSEHEGGLNPIALLKQRYGVTVRYTAIGLRDCDPLAELEQALSPRTRAVVLSHASWATGVVLPMRQIAELAHSVGALVICDAAQSCGMIPTNVYELGIDAYACSGQKWLCGPDSTGALFVRRDCLDRIQQTFMAYPSLKSRMINNEAIFEPCEGARRYEAVTLSPPALKAFSASLAWIADDIGWDWAYRRIAELGRYCYAALAQIDGLRLYLPQQAVAGLIHFTLDGMAPMQLTERLYQQGIMIRHTPEPQLNRVATGFYNNTDDIDRLAQGIQAIHADLGRS
jgi:L-cysteine/cystine lyase